MREAQVPAHTAASLWQERGIWILGLGIQPLPSELFAFKRLLNSLNLKAQQILSL